MKKMIIAMLIIIGLMSIGNSMNYYTRHDCVVYSIDGNIITVEDNSGRLWEFIAEDNHSYDKFDTVDLKMYNNNTDNTIEDDKIIGVN